MKTPIQKIATYTALILISSMPFSANVYAEAEKKQPSTPVQSVTDKTTSAVKPKVMAEKQSQVDNDARDSLNGTQQALLDLEKNDTNAALETLRDVSKKLETILNKHPEMAFVTADIDVDVLDFMGDQKTIKEQVKQADQLLDDGKLQGAREILGGMASEMRVTTVNVPLGTFPAEIKKAIDDIDAGKTDDAKNVLSAVLTTLVEVTEVIPLPILRAEALLSEAAKLEHQDDLSKEKNRDEVLKFTDAAKDSLKTAELLGYGGKDDYKTLYTAIDEIKETMFSEKSEATKQKIEKILSDLKNKLMHPGK